MKPFYVAVKTVDDAKLVLNTLWDYDTFQFENKIKPDYSNVSGLEVFEVCEGGFEWCEWNNDEGDDICDVIRNEE